MADLNQITKTGKCDSCGQDKILHASAHQQNNNPVLHWYCDMCKFADEKEKRVQAKLAKIASSDLNAANDPAVAAKLHNEVATDILLEKAQNEQLPANEEIIEPEIVSA